MEHGSILGTVLTYLVLAIVLLAIGFGVTRAAWFFSMLVWMNLAKKGEPGAQETRRPTAPAAGGGPKPGDGEQAVKLPS